MAATRLGDELYAQLDQRLEPLDRARLAAYPGPGSRRQPVHTAYLPADRYQPGATAEWGAAAQALFDAHLPGPVELAELLDLGEELAEQVHPRVAGKLDREPVEDLRIDFEDGYGDRGEEIEDADAARVAASIRADIDSGRSPASIGLRCKGLEPAGRRRGLRTLDLVMTALFESGGLPDGWIVTLPKVTSLEQVAAFADVCAAWEHSAGLPESTLRFEVQIETPQAILGADGTATVARMVHAAAGRLTGLHYGTYDYGAACGVTAANQSLDHPVADHAKATMQLAAAATGVHVSDGSSNVLPVGDAPAIRQAWRLHGRLVQRSLTRAIYQGWDLHPGQLVTRYAANFAFYRAEFPAAADRLRQYRAGTTDAGVLDEPATAQAMASVLFRGLNCGALDEAEVAERAGVDVDALLELYRRRVG